MGQNEGRAPRTAQIKCRNCEELSDVPWKYRQDGPKPATYCSRDCHLDAQRKGRDRPNLGRYKNGHGTGAPKGRAPWNKGKQCPQLAGERNGMYGRTHTPEVRELLSKLASSQLSELTRQRLAGAVAPIRRSDPEYSRIFRVGWRPIRQKAIARDGGVCKMCSGKPKRLTVHHIIPFSISLRHELENLITLCYPCHNIVHRTALDLSAGEAEPVLENVAE